MRLIAVEGVERVSAADLTTFIRLDKLEREGLASKGAGEARCERTPPPRGRDNANNAKVEAGQAHPARPSVMPAATRLAPGHHPQHLARPPASHPDQRHRITHARRLDNLPLTMVLVEGDVSMPSAGGGASGSG